ncbi:MAG TPA: flagellar export chaperone FliS [Candidatus Hydrogenedentes bacterium]|nr:flagellar export chaperone FliS [Candidatus Hydrogenedentota bacterium]
MSASAASYGAYKRVDVETASQGKIVVMLFNGAIQRAEEAKRQLSKGRTEGVHNNLIRAQDIVGELRSALNMKAAIAKQLDRIYEYFQHLLITANVKKECGPLEEVIAHLTGMRDTWHEAFNRVAKEQGGAQPAPVVSHGASVINIQG